MFLFLVCLFYDILVNAFYFHKVFPHTQTNLVWLNVIKCK